MATKDWKVSKHYARPTVKRAWEEVEQPGDTLAIDYIPSSNMPYKIMLNHNEIDSTGTFARAMKLASNYRRNN